MTSEAAVVQAVGRFTLRYLRIRPDRMPGLTAVYPQHSLSLCLRSPGGLNWQPGFRVIARASATRSVSRDAPQVSRQLTVGHGALRRAASSDHKSLAHFDKTEHRTAYTPVKREGEICMNEIETTGYGSGGNLLNCK